MFMGVPLNRGGKLVHAFVCVAASEKGECDSFTNWRRWSFSTPDLALRCVQCRAWKASASDLTWEQRRLALFNDKVGVTNRGRRRSRLWMGAEHILVGMTT